MLLHLYLHEGPGFFAQLRGMFAVAVWDRREQRLLLARDRFGIKPLYYSDVGGRLTFASELKALLSDPAFPRSVDREALHSYLAFNSIPAPLTIFGAARKLPPGHLLSCTPAGASIERFARPAPAAADHVRSEAAETLAEELRERLRDSVQAHLLADVPVGVLLSGGVDSSTLTALAAAGSTERVSTFSIGFRERSFNELDLAREVARRYDTDHHELVVSPDVSELLPEVVAAFDEPFADSSAVPTYLVSQLAAEHVKVVLSGEGGDELFGGYETYVADQLARRVGPMAARMAPLVDHLPSSNARVSLEYRARRFTRAAALPPLERHHGWKEIFSDRQRAELLTDGWQDPAADPLRPWRARFAETEDAPMLARLQDVDLGVYLADDLLVKTDRMSMVHSLETRVPFLDPVVAELALALPDQTEGARTGQEAAAPAGGRAADPGEHHQCPQARLLDPGRGLAARRARAVRPGGPRAAAHRAPRVTSSRPRSRGCSTSTSPAARTTAASCGACCPSRSGSSRPSSEQAALPAPRVLRGRGHRRGRPPGPGSTEPATPPERSSGRRRRAARVAAPARCGYLGGRLGRGGARPRDRRRAGCSDLRHSAADRRLDRGQRLGDALQAPALGLDAEQRARPRRRRSSGPAPMASATNTSDVLPVGISRPNSCGPMIPPMPGADRVEQRDGQRASLHGEDLADRQVGGADAGRGEEEHHRPAQRQRARGELVLLEQVGGDQQQRSPDRM